MLSVSKRPISTHRRLIRPDKISLVENVVNGFEQKKSNLLKFPSVTDGYLSKVSLLSHSI